MAKRGREGKALRATVAGRIVLALRLLPFGWPPLLGPCAGENACKAAVSGMAGVFEDADIFQPNHPRLCRPRPGIEARVLYRVAIEYLVRAQKRESLGDERCRPCADFQDRCSHLARQVSHDANGASDGWDIFCRWIWCVYIDLDRAN